MKSLCRSVATSLVTFGTTLALLFSHQMVSASPASPFAFEEAQPDGSRIHLHIEGDEFFHRQRLSTAS